MLLNSKLLLQKKQQVKFINTVRTLEHKDLELFKAKSKTNNKEENLKKKRNRQSIERKKELISICKQLGANFIETSDLIITKTKPLGVGKTAQVYEGLLRCQVAEINIKEGLTAFKAEEDEKVIIEQDSKGKMHTFLHKLRPKMPKKPRKPRKRQRGISCVSSAGKVLELEPLEVALKVAIKKFTCRFVTETVAKTFLQEIRALCQLNHEGVVSCLGIYVDEIEEHQKPLEPEDNLQLLIIYELCSRGDLRQLKKEGSWPGISFVDRFKMVLPALKALAHIHQQNLVHRDLKIDNILVSENFTLKIGDFGVAKVLKPFGKSNRDGTSESTVKGTLGYTAPEIVGGKARGTKESDVFSIGVILYELVCDYEENGVVFRQSNPLMKPINQYESQFKNNKHIEMLRYSKYVPNELINCISSCLSNNPAERYSSSQVVQVVESLLN